jgi:hypothetical protein
MAGAFALVLTICAALSAPRSFPRDFVANAVAASDLAGAGTVDADRGVRMVSAFTADRSMTELAVADPNGSGGGFRWCEHNRASCLRRSTSLSDACGSATRPPVSPSPAEGARPPSKR